MDFLGVGPLEFFFILLIALIVLGPNDMVKAGRTLGRFLRRLVTSPGWQVVQQTSREIRTLPNRLMREAGLDELKDQLPNRQQMRDEMGLNELNAESKRWKEDMADWITPPPTILPPDDAAASPSEESAPPATPQEKQPPIEE